MSVTTEVVTWLNGFPTWVGHGLIFGFALANILLGITAYSIWFERKFAGRMQNRPGPTEVGPFGLLQPIADAVKREANGPARVSCAACMLDGAWRNGAPVRCGTRDRLAGARVPWCRA